MMYLGIYAAIMFALVFLREWGQTATLNKFLVAERSVGGFIGAMSIAASWIWAPAIFVSTRVGYEWGYSGLVWFIVPNVLALLTFAPVAALVRSRLPEGYSYVQSLRGSRGGFWQAQLTVQLLMQVVIFALQLTAGAELLAAVTGSDFRLLAIGMGLTPFCYGFFSGLRTSVFTDAIKYAVIAASAIAIVSRFPAGEIKTAPRAFDPFDHKMLLAFGLSSGISLLVAIFADHQQWQRAFAAKRPALIRTYCFAGAFHGLVTTLLGTFGVLIYRSGFAAPEKLDLVGIHFIRSNYQPIFAVIFVIMALSALIGTLDSGLCAFSSLYITEKSSAAPTLGHGRLLMFTLAGAGIGIALMHLPILTLWFVAGTIRLASFAPTLASILKPETSGLAGTIAIIGGLAIGGSIFGMGAYQDDAVLKTIGMVASITTSLLIVAGGAFFNRQASS